MQGTESRRSTYSAALIAFTLVLAISARPAAADDDPASIVEHFHGALVSVMKSGADSQTRQATLAPLVSATFDIATISRIALGRYWHQLDVPQQQGIQEAIGHLLVSTYVERFDTWSGQHFVFDGTAPLGPGRMMVRTRLVVPDGDTVNLDYQLSKHSGDWRVYDIIANGVSDLALKRSQYTHAFESGGYDAVIRAINDGASKTDY